MIGIVPVSYEDIVNLNEFVIAQTSQPEDNDIVSVINRGNIRNCCDLLTNSFYDTERFKGIFQKAAAFLDCIVRGHGFASANKRTSIAGVNLLLYRNGWVFEPNEETIIMTLKSAREEVSIDELELWIRTCSKPKNL